MDNVENSQIPNNQTEENNEKPTKQKRVINEVEDRKAIDEGKQKGDKQFQIDAKQAIREYSNTYELIKEIKSSYEGDKTSDFYKFVLEYEIKVISNLALCNKKLNNWEKSIEYDLIIINELDKYFDKSYARTISNYHNMGQFKKALEFYYKFKSTFLPECLKKHEEYLKDFLKALEKDEKLRNQSRNIPKTKSNYFKRIVLVIGLVALMVLGVLLYNQLASGNKIPHAQTENTNYESSTNDNLDNNEKDYTNKIIQEGAEDL